MSEELRPGRSPGLRTGRLEAFSDGVFAIAITLLVLELSVPEGSGDDLLGALLDQWPSYLAYIVSFATIGAAWVAHTAITNFVERTDARFARLNLLLLAAVAVLPFPTGLVAEYITEDRAVRVAVTVFGIGLLLIAVLNSLLWQYAVHSDLIGPEHDAEVVASITHRVTPGLAGYVAMIVLGLFLPVVAVFGYLVVALVLLIPIRRTRAG